MIRTNIRGRKYSNIFEYPNIRHTMFTIIFATTERLIISFINVIKKRYLYNMILDDIIWYLVLYEFLWIFWGDFGDDLLTFWRITSADY